MTRIMNIKTRKMKNIFHILLVVVAISGICSSCGSLDDKHAYTELGDNLDFGNGILKDSIVILGNDLDNVNGTALETIITPVATWLLGHKNGINWWRWLILILIVGGILYNIALIIYLLYHSLLWVASKFLSFAIPSYGQKIIKTKIDIGEKGEKRNDKKDDKKDLDAKRDQFIVDCERTLLSSGSSVSQKASTLERLFIYWDYDLLESKKEFESKMLDKRIMDAMDCLWNRNTFYKHTKRGMRWLGLEWDSTLIPDPTVTPGNKNYSNIENLTWGEIMERHNFQGLSYHKGKPDFSQIASHTVQLLNFDRFVDSNSDTERGPLQEEAFRILANNLHKTVEEIRTYKEQNRLVWHEDTDCKTLYLVPQEIHNNLHHFGGIGMLKILRKNGLYLDLI